MSSPDKRTRPREERATWLRGQWSGQNKLMRGTRPATQFENLLQGVLFNAVSRATNGKQLSELEQKLVTVASNFADDESELAEYGQVFQESKRSYATNMQSLFPSALLELGDDEAFTYEHLIACAAEAADEVMAMPENKVIDLAQVEGSYKEDPEYMRAVKDAGRGAILFDSSKISVNAGHTNFNNLWPHRWYARKAPGDAMGSRAEIYFTWSCGADDESQRYQKSQTWGSVTNETVHNFPGGTLLWDGYMEFVLFGYIQAWEEDDSTAGWVDALIKFCDDAAGELAKGAMETARSPNREAKKTAVMLALGAGLSYGIAAIITAWRNMDDKIGEIMIGFTKAGLSELVDRANNEIELPISSNNMGEVYIYLRGGTWGPTVGKAMMQRKMMNSWGLPGEVHREKAKSFEGMPMVDFNGRLIGCYNNYEDAKIMWTTYDLFYHVWSAPQWIEPHQARGRVATCTWRSSLWLTYRDLSDRVRLLRTSGGDYQRWVPATSKDGIVPAFIAASYWGLTVYHKTQFGPAMAALENGDSSDCIIIAIMMAENIYYSVSADGGDAWSSIVYYQTDTGTRFAPTLVNFSGVIYMFWINKSDDYVYYARYQASTKTFVNPNSATIQSSGSVGACVSNGDLLLTYRSPEKDNYTVKMATYKAKPDGLLQRATGNIDIPNSVAYSGVQVVDFGSTLYVTYGNPS